MDKVMGQIVFHSIQTNTSRATMFTADPNIRNILGDFGHDQTSCLGPINVTDLSRHRKYIGLQSQQ